MTLVRMSGLVLAAVAVLVAGAGVCHAVIALVDRQVGQVRLLEDDESDREPSAAQVEVELIGYVIGGGLLVALTAAGFMFLRKKGLPVQRLLMLSCAACLLAVAEQLWTRPGPRLGSLASAVLIESAIAVGTAIAILAFDGVRRRRLEHR